MTTGYDLREGAQILTERFAKNSAEAHTASLSLPLSGGEPWSVLTPLPSAEPTSKAAA